MPLTKEEREFLDAYVFEAMHEPFGGPATTELRGRGLYYADLHGFLVAYHRELTGEGTPPLGKHASNPRACPWADRDTALRRNRALMKEYARPQSTSRSPSDPGGGARF